MTVTLNLSGLKSYQRMYENFTSGNSINNLAKEVQELAREAIKNRYFQTKGHSKYRSKGMKQHLEYRLFDLPLPSPVKTGSTSFDIALVPDPATINEDVPHLKWQEYGTKSMVDRQPYLITSTGLRSIKKVDAAQLMRRKRSVGRILLIDVPHPALRARHFIKAGSLFLRNYWPSIVKNWYQRELEKWVINL